MENKTKIRKGMIVTKCKYRTGNYPFSRISVGSTTKVLSQRNEFCDETFKTITQFSKSNNPKKFSENALVLCESVPCNSIKISSIHCNNKPAYYEKIGDLRPATDTEKEEYYKMKHLNSYEVSVMEFIKNKEYDVEFDRIY